MRRPAGSRARQCRLHPLKPEVGELDKIQCGPESSLDDPEKVRRQAAKPAGELFPIQREVTWWQRAMFDRFRPPAPKGNGTAVGPLSSCALDVETGMTMTVFQLGARLKPSWDTTMTGL